MPGAHWVTAPVGALEPELRPQTLEAKTMRIAYIAPYQGPTLVKRRPIVRNFSLGGRAKVQLIAELLQTSSHDVEVLSQGEVIEHQFKLYPAFCEPEPFHAKIPVYYSSCFPVQYLNGLWSGLSLLRIFKARHRISPYDVVLIYNLKPPQVICAKYASRRLGLPVIVEYEDDAFGDNARAYNLSRFTSRFFLSAGKKTLASVAGCVGVSPYLLSQTPSSIPKLLLRGVVGDEILQAKKQGNAARKDRVVFSGTHYRRQGLVQLIEAWRKAELAGWELHIAGHGEMTSALQELAANSPSIVFHGVLNREENARLLCTAKIGIVPREVDQTAGSVFAFKTIEYLAAGLHVITTPMGPVEKEIAAGITYVSDNTADTIAAGLKQVVRDRRYERKAERAAVQMYGSTAVSRSLNLLLEQVVRGRTAMTEPA